MDTTNRSLNPKFFRLLLLTVITLTNGCDNVPPGTPEQALVARALVSDGQSKIAQIGSEIATLLDRYKDTQAGQIFIVEPPILPPQPILLADLEPIFGIHRELTPGVFEVITGQQEVSIQYLNGIDIGFHNLEFDASTDQLLSYQIDILSNRRSIATPPSQVATVNLTISNFNLAQPIAGLEPTGITTTGSVEYALDDGTALSTMKYTINRFLGTASAGGLNLTSGKQIQFTDVINKESWTDTETVLYSDNSTPGTWIGRNIIKLYQDNAVRYSITMSLLNGFNVANTNKATFAGIGQVIFENARVAYVSGGPYSCDITNPGNIGTGTTIKLTWRDIFDDILMPNNVNNCARAIILEPPTP
jgi:hypothetical protein